jgi:BirA family biotin operon repressor/biotin-[acetyl-CoA-carboxylase] ligase
MRSADLLDAAAISRGLSARGEAFDVEVLRTCGSTNTELLGRTRSATPVLLLAEAQTAGRGRRGRRWYADPGAALMFSLRWEFAGDASQLRGLSLACGVAIAKALRGFGAKGVALKWPNDLLASMGTGGAKLGGILIETRSSAGRITAVIGVGLNYRRMPGLEERLKREVASIEEAIEPLPSRNALAIGIVAEVGAMLRSFEAAGFEPFRSQWESMHAHQGEPMRVRMAGGRVVAGIADGVAADGGLRLRTRSGVECIYSGTVVRGMSGQRSAA